MRARVLSLAGHKGWPLFGLAALSGAIGALALAPFDCLPALIVTMTVAVLLLDACASGADQGGWTSIRAAWLIGWWQGFGYFTAGLWWLGNAFLVDADQFAWALPLGVFGLPALLALFNACGFALARWLWSAHPVRIVTLAAALALSELLRGVVMTGFPWNAYGMALSSILPLAQTAALVGLPGLTMIMVGVAAAPATLLDDAPLRQRLTAPVAALGLLACMTIGGLVRLDQPAVMREHVLLRVIQPIIPQDDKFSMANAKAIMQTYIDLTLGDTHAASDPMDGVTHVIWPESSFPFILGREPLALQMIADMLKHKAILITGAIREERRISETPQGTVAQRHYYNSAQVVGADGSILASADKVHLVPFGEYLPFSDLLSQWGLRRFVTAPGSFSTGEASRQAGQIEAAQGFGREQRPRPGLARLGGRDLSDLLRGDFSGGCDPAKPAALGAGQSHQRCMVRFQPRSAPAFCPGPLAHDRGRPADGAVGQCRYIGGDRSVRPHPQGAAARSGKCPDLAAAPTPATHSLCQNRLCPRHAVDRVGIGGEPVDQTQTLG